MSMSLDEQLQRCSVKISQANKNTHEGTGFFVAPHLILTCAHVIQNAQKNNAALKINGQEQEADARIYNITDSIYPDLALLETDIENHPCVYLHDVIRLKDSLYIYGYPDQQPNGDSATLEYEGSSHNPLKYKLKAGQIRPGFSGSPVLNLNTGLVCAIVKSTRNSESDLGGRAIPVSVILQQFPELITKQENYHRHNEIWLQSLSAEQRKNFDNQLMLEQSITAIETLFVQVRHDQAYEKFRQLCTAYPDYQVQASSILARYSDFQQNVILGIIPFSEQTTEKMRIAASFQMCLKQFKQEYLCQ